MRNKIKKIAIANRGEVAVRIIRACQELGIRTALLHSEADIKTLAYRLSDEQVCIGPAPVEASYLDIDNNINGALSVGADAIHPGFGFLSEKSVFARACKKNHLIFVGPSAEAIDLFGDKVSAKKIVQSVGVPLVKGYQEEDQSIDRLAEEADAIGYPVMVKCVGGGGGRGLRIIRSASESAKMIESAQREGQSSFGSDKVFLEKYLEEAKHVEVQIFGDATGHVFHLYDRECSIQRRHQKIIEEAIAPTLNFELRQKLFEAATSIAREGKYKGAGTVEFLVDGEDYYFLEMNTRLQVEHPVTEMVMGVDLVKAQILTAAGESTQWFQEELQPTGHAIECRIYAENSSGIPSVGAIVATSFPQGPGRRFDVGFVKGDEVTSYYDAMIAKVIVWDESRPRALAKMKACLKDTIIFGIQTNIPYLLEILNHPDFVGGQATTQFIEKNFPDGLELKDLTEKQTAIIDQVRAQWTSTQRLSEEGQPDVLTSAWMQKGKS